MKITANEAFVLSEKNAYVDAYTEMILSNIYSKIREEARKGETKADVSKFIKLADAVKIQDTLTKDGFYVYLYLERHPGGRKEMIVNWSRPMVAPTISQ
jgi:hypothetical protein